MPEITLIAPQDITVGDTTYHIVVPAQQPVTPPSVEPPATVGKAVAYVAKRGSGDWIVRRDSVRLDIDAAGTIRFGSQPIPGSTGAVAVGYDPGTNRTYRQTTEGGLWSHWGGSMTDAADWAAPQGWAIPSDTVPPVAPAVGGSPKARLLAYLKSISGKNLLAGQVSHADSREINANRQALGFDIAIQVFDPWLVQWAGNYVYDIEFMPAALAHAAAGGIVGIEFNLPNPAGGGGSQDGNQPNAEEILRPGTAQNRALLGFLDQGIAITQQFKDRGYPLLFRVYWEMDGGWFWWGDAGQKRLGKFDGDAYGRLWRMTRNYMESKGQDHLLWQFAVNGGPGNYTYPGDDVVDIVGVDGYTSDPAGRYKRIYDQLQRQAPDKVIGFLEWGSGDPGANDKSFNTQTLIDAIRNQMPKVCMANAWSGWEWALETNPRGALSSPFLIHRPVRY